MFSGWVDGVNVVFRETIARKKLMKLLLIFVMIAFLQRWLIDKYGDKAFGIMFWVGTLLSVLIWLVYAKSERK